MKQRLTITGLIIILVVSLFSCKQEKQNYYKYEGFIQGTSFSVIYEYTGDLAPQIDSLLKAFNRSLDNYDSTSLISKVNQNENPPLDSLFKQMFYVSEDVWQRSDGLFDISIAPLVNAWGFGYKSGQFPDSAQVDSLLEFVGFGKLSIVDDHIVKSDPRMEIIGNALAQGLSVDFVSEQLKAMGVVNFLVEIGGEIYAEGLNYHGEAWRVGIDKPLQDSTVSRRELIFSIGLSGKALATSGNYRKYHIVDGKVVGHAVNPVTGYPYSTDILSATVIHKECVYADAWATAFMLMQSDQALALANETEGLELMLVTATNKDTLEYEVLTTGGFPEMAGPGK